MTEKEKLHNNICEEAIGLCCISGLNQVQKERYEWLCKKEMELRDEIMKERLKRLGLA